MGTPRRSSRVRRTTTRTARKPCACCAPGSSFNRFACALADAMAAAKRKPSASAASMKSFDADVPSERDALKTWNDMDDAALEVEIAKYRDAWRG